MAKRRVLIVYRSYFPSLTHLGPATTIRNIVTNLSDSYEFHILTLNFDFSNNKPLFAQPHHKVISNNVTIEYLPLGWRSMVLLQNRLRDNFDVVDIHCTFDQLLAIPALIASKLGIAGRAAVFHTPHGIFMDTIMSVRATRKRMFCHAAEYLGLYSHVTHLAGSVAEKKDIERRFRSAQRIKVTSQFIESGINNSAPRRKGRDSLRIAMVGRVTAQKNVTYAINLLQQLNVPATLDIFGDTNDHHYYEQCLALTTQDTRTSAIRFAGNLDKSDLLRSLAHYDVLLHPTLGENFGHAIVESLSVGLPVLVSDLSPWTDLAAHNAGWSLPLTNPQAFVSKLEKLYAMGDEWSELSAGARSYVRKKFDRAETAARYRTAYG